MNFAADDYYHEQIKWLVANLLYAQTNSASYPQRDRKWVVDTATGWRPSVADWGNGVSASCTVGPIVR